MYILDDPPNDGEKSSTTSTCTNPHLIITEQSVKNAAAKWTLKMREGHRIPQSVMESIVSGASSLFQLALSGLQQTLQSRLQDSQVSEDASSLVMECFNSGDQYTRVFQGLETTYRQNSYIRTHFPFVVCDINFVHVHVYNIACACTPYCFYFILICRNQLKLFLALGK